VLVGEEQTGGDEETGGVPCATLDDGRHLDATDGTRRYLTKFKVANGEDVTAFDDALEEYAVAWTHERTPLIEHFGFGLQGGDLLLYDLRGLMARRGVHGVLIVDASHK